MPPVRLLHLGPSASAAKRLNSAFALSGMPGSNWKELTHCFSTEELMLCFSTEELMLCFSTEELYSLLLSVLWLNLSEKPR